jgi:hypothetical protein
LIRISNACQFAQGVKAHVLLDHDDYLPAYVLLTEAKRSFAISAAFAVVALPVPALP